MKYWVSCKKMTVWIRLSEKDGSTIVDCADVVKKRFKYEEFYKLLGWFSKIGGLRVERLEERCVGLMTLERCSLEGC